MSTPEPQIPELPSSLSLIQKLGAVALISGLLVALVYEYTKPMIADNQRVALEGALFKVLPTSASSRLTFRLENSQLSPVPDDTPNDGNLVYAGYDKDHKLVGIALTAAAQGYQDMVKILYAYDPYHSCIKDFVVLKSTETPGFGDKIATDESFLKNFECLDARVNEEQSALAQAIRTVRHGTKKNPWEIDAIAGATITSNAVGRMLDKSGQLFHPAIAQNLNLLENAQRATQP
ncbi:FMN-binding protein [Methylobacter sp. YRD-M1]|uniref:FMN-binding protein n=1 Tax=Methylobacter sp. YRD-M1 TaxID=2911520 RepID=UPI00227CE734|nr:FMN-binding protein [Methylobacter sp. YRD-M1]WAK01415.1 FMN-binding protein [Methylobacter sp. YRD-M1]